MVTGQTGRPAPETGLPVGLLRRLPVIVYDRVAGEGEAHTKYTISLTLRIDFSDSLLAASARASRVTSAIPIRSSGGGDLEEGGSFADYDSLKSPFGDFEAQCSTTGGALLDASKGSPPGSGSSSEHEWPLRLGAHAGETKRTCAVCLVRGCRVDW